MRLTNAGRLAPMGAFVDGVGRAVVGARADVGPGGAAVGADLDDAAVPAAGLESEAVLEGDRSAGRRRRAGSGRRAICSSGRSAFSPSVWPLLSGPHQTWRVGESARRCQASMLGEVVGSPAIVQPWFARLRPTPSAEAAALLVVVQAVRRDHVEAARAGPAPARRSRSGSRWTRRPTAPFSATRIGVRALAVLLDGPEARARCRPGTSRAGCWR